MATPTFRKNLLINRATVGPGDAATGFDRIKTISIMLTGVGEIRVVGQIMASNIDDPRSFVNIGNFNLQGTDVVNEIGVHDAPWVSYRFDILEISGQGAKVSAAMGS